VRKYREKFKDRRLWNEILKQVKNLQRIVASVEEEEEEEEERRRR
jgi:predicted membrane chloride channel (bestrophin family)